jgi:aconitate hydratase
VFAGDAAWRRIKAVKGLTYRWDDSSTYVKNPPYFAAMRPVPEAPGDVTGARLLAVLGDSITTDHISPAGAIKKDSPAGRYLVDHGVGPADFNSYGARRGNHEIMMRGTFANIRLRNEMAPGTEGGVTRHLPSGETMPIYDAAMRYQGEGVSLVVVAGKEYGTGSSRDWAAKGTLLLGVRAVIAESFERIHRSNLVGMGVLALQFKDGVTRKTLGLDGSERISIAGVDAGLRPRAELTGTIERADGRRETVALLCRIDTADELDYFRHGGILPYVLRGAAKAA